jgi:5'-deoxynucleotidase YfbR-like HD superfamily hydrolase
VTTVNYERLKLMRVAGRVLRCHTTPLIHRQTVGEHTFGVLNILLAILGSRIHDYKYHKMLIAAIYHDAPEAITGDVPANTKWNYPLIEEGLKAAEEKIECEYDLFRIDPSSEEGRLLKFADGMELAIFCLEEMRMGNRNVEKMAYRIFEAIEKRGLVDITPEAYDLFMWAKIEFELFSKEDHVNDKP